MAQPDDQIVLPEFGIFAPEAMWACWRLQTPIMARAIWMLSHGDPITEHIPPMVEIPAGTWIVVDLPIPIMWWITVMIDGKREHIYQAEPLIVCEAVGIETETITHEELLKILTKEADDAENAARPPNQTIPSPSTPS